jgi:hypothetical protein
VLALLNARKRSAGISKKCCHREPPIFATANQQVD